MMEKLGLYDTFIPQDKVHYDCSDLGENEIIENYDRSIFLMYYKSKQGYRIITDNPMEIYLSEEQNKSWKLTEFLTNE